MELTLRPWAKGEGERLAEVFNESNREYTSNRRPDPYPAEEAGRWLECVTEKEGTEGLFYAILSGEKYIGFITVEQQDDVHCRDAEIGYLLKTEAESRGIATWAVGEMCRKAFEALDIVRITAYVSGENAGSRRVLEKNGFVLEGVMKQAIFKNGRLQDNCIYAKYRQEPEG